MTPTETVTDSHLEAPTQHDDDGQRTERAIRHGGGAHTEPVRTTRAQRGARPGEPMELLDFLRVAKRRWYVLVGVPLLAALLAFGYVLLAPTVWTATATVSAPALVGGEFGTQYTGSQAVNQYVAQFQAVASGPAVRRAVAEQTGVKPAEISEGLTIAQVGASTVMTITFEDGVSDNVEPVIAGVANTTLDMLFGQQVVLATSLVKGASESLTGAASAIEKWEADNSIVSPGDVYREKLSQISNLEQQAVTLQANGNSAGAAAAKARAATVQGELKSFGPLLATYDALVSTRDAAAASQSQAQQTLQNAKAQQMAADPAAVVFTGRVHDSGKADEITAMVLPVTAAGIFLGVVLVVALEMIAASRRRSADATSESTVLEDHDGKPADDAPIDEPGGDAGTSRADGAPSAGPGATSTDQI